MAHKHSLYDADTHFKIDPVTRAIENMSGKTVLMQKDHNSEIFTFELPRYVDGHDMSKCNRVEAHFINTDNATKEKSRDYRTLTDLQVSPDSEEVVICSWQLDKDVTAFAGSLAFMLRFSCVAEDDVTIDYAWHTASYDKFTVQKNLCKDDDNEVNRVIARGSTPTHSFSIPFDTSAITGVLIMYAQGGEEVFRKKTADCTITDHDVSVTLTQSETLSLKAEACKVQMVVYSADKALVSNTIEVSVDDILSEDVAE